MAGYVLRRLLYVFVVLWGVTLVIFILLHLTGDPTYLLLPEDAPDAAVADLRRELGLDKPVWTQYAIFFLQLLRGNIGTSFRHRASALPLVLAHLPATLELTGAALAVGVAISMPLGAVAATRRGSWVDHSVRAVAVAGHGLPPFWLGILLIELFSVHLRLLPPSGKGSLLQLLMPAFSLGYYSSAIVMRLLRTSLLEVLSADYVQTARAKGLARRIVLWKHAVRNALGPVITIMGLEVGRLLGGAIATEAVFAWPGVGTFLLEGVRNFDYPIVEASVFLFAVIIVLVNLLTDLSYGFLDPRIRYQ